MHPLFLSISVTLCYSSSYLIFPLIHLYTLRFVPFIGDATLSATSFGKDGKITLTIPVNNVGKKDGTETIQVYVKDPTDADGPLKSLKAYQRVAVKAGQTVNAIITLDSKSFELFDATTNTVRTKGGKYEVYYGNSSADKDLKKVNVKLKIN